MSDLMEELAGRLVVGRKRDGRAVYDEEAKAELVAAFKLPGASVSSLARSCGVNANQLSRWLREDGDRRRSQHVDGAAQAVFVPVTVDTARAPATSSAITLQARLPNGVMVSVAPAAFIETARLVKARRLLESEEFPLKSTAHLVGFASEQSLRKLFRKHLRITPDEYRSRFGGTSKRISLTQGKSYEKTGFFFFFIQYTDRHSVHAMTFVVCVAGSKAGLLARGTEARDGNHEATRSGTSPSDGFAAKRPRRSVRAAGRPSHADGGRHS